MRPMRWTVRGGSSSAEAGPNPRLLELAPDGSVKVEFPLAGQKQNAHMQSRMTRKQADRFEKKVVWKWQANVANVHHFQVLAVDGIAVPWPPLR